MTVSFMLTACEDQEKNKLDNRVIGYWNLKINRDFKQAYKFLSPGWRANENELAYAQRMTKSVAKWQAVKLIDKQCTQKNLCKITVNIEYEYRFPGMGGQKMTVDTDLHENWILKNNVWYIVPIKEKRIK